MFKQSDELQRQKKLQELNNARQQNVMQNKRSSLTQYGLLNFGVPVRDASQMFMFGDTNMVHGLPNRLVFSQQSSMGHLVHFQGPSFSQGVHIGGQTRKTQQSAVAEAFNGDSGVQEEWSGLSFQNPELSNENPTSNMMVKKEEDDEKRSTFMVKPGMGQQVASSSMIVKKEEDDEKRLTFKFKPGMGQHGQQVACSRRRPNTGVDVPMQKKRPSTSNRKMKTGFEEGSSKMRQRGNNGPAVSLKSKVSSKMHQCETNEVALTQSSLIYEQQLNVDKEKMVVLNSKKRKFSAFKQLPWHQNLTEGCTSFHDTRNAELEWAHSVKRLPEKVANLIPVVDRKRRRLISTTQLMQMLFRPPPTLLFSENATKYCDIVTYYIAKLALGDACSLAGRTSRSSDDLDLSKNLHGFIDRSKKMEDVFLRLEKKGSTILDVKVEFQDLDKFSVINRFAKFHSRGATNDTSSSGGDSTMQKSDPLRYVTSSEMPRIVPEGRNCLSL